MFWIREEEKALFFSFSQNIQNIQNQNLKKNLKSVFQVSRSRSE